MILNWSNTVAARNCCQRSKIFVFHIVNMWLIFLPIDKHTQNETNICILHKVYMWRYNWWCGFTYSAPRRHRRHGPAPWHSANKQTIIIIYLDLAHRTPALSVQSVCLSISSMLSSCREKKRPPDNAFYIMTGPKNPKKTKWWYHGELIYIV